MPSFSKIANGSISPSRFVSLDTTNNGQVIQTVGGSNSTVGVAIYGISQAGTREPPYGALDDGYAAIAGENLMIYGPGSDKDVFLELGATVSPGDTLCADSSGRGVKVTADVTWVGAIAQQGGILGQLIKVQPIFSRPSSGTAD